MPTSRTAPDPDRSRASVRGRKTRAARDDRYAFVTIILDRETNTIACEHPFLSAAEAYGVLVVAEQRERERLVCGDLDPKGDDE